MSESFKDWVEFPEGKARLSRLGKEGKNGKFVYTYEVAMSDGRSLWGGFQTRSVGDENRYYVLVLVFGYEFAGNVTDSEAMLPRRIKLSQIEAERIEALSRKFFVAANGSIPRVAPYSSDRSLFLDKVEFEPGWLLAEDKLGPPPSLPWAIGRG